MNDDQQNTPPVAQTPQPPQDQAPRAHGSGARAGAIALAVFGGIALLAAGGTAAFAATHDVRDAARPGPAGAQSQTVDATGIQTLRMDVAGSDVTARFGDVEEATLEVDGKRGSNWTLERDDDELVVSSPDRGFGWWFDSGWFGDDWFSDETVILTLPESLNGGRLDAEFTLSAGSLDIDGSYGEVDVEVGAGDLKIDGSATSLDANVNAGRADLVLADVTEAEFTVSAGKIVAELIDTTPSSVTIDVSAGSLDLTVPDDTYRVTQEVSAGSFDNRLNTSTESRFAIDASVSAGSVVLRSGD